MLNRWLLNYQETTQNKFNVHTSDSLIKIYKKRSYVDFNPYLIYDRIKYKCSTREKNELDSADTCPARLSVSTSPHKKTLQVNECHLNHNHAPMIIGRDGPFKQRQLLLENAIMLHQEMEKKKKPRGDKIIHAQKSCPSSLKTIDKLTMKKPVVTREKYLYIIIYIYI
ncbi:uncharacterized protein LOC141534010 [Cotesia typhae]|uniref:uncharacterized protein LOC141534010 n=1 Tax=Cotesia typhae TaxID=2053667 RepID=UPI003D698754